jgi:4-hydroxybenzoate polyprenyltransferase
VPHAVALVIASSLAFILAAKHLNPLAFALSFPTLAVLLGYSYTKRFTSFSHFVLGFCLGIAPIGAWVALQGRIAIDPILLGAGVMFWVAGFDIIYATLDREFDEKAGLHSFVRRFGVRGALRWSRVFHFLFVAFLTVFALVAHMGPAFGIGVALISGFLIYEHRLVRPDDLSRVNVAFFTLNGVVSLAVFTFACLDIAVRRT